MQVCIKKIPSVYLSPSDLCWRGSPPTHLTPPLDIFVTRGRINCIHHEVKNFKISTFGEIHQKCGMVYCFSRVSPANKGYHSCIASGWLVQVLPQGGGALNFLDFTERHLIRSFGMNSIFIRHHNDAAIISTIFEGSEDSIIQP